MSLSAADNGNFARASGKTPPPAPSAAFAKRAREIQAEERAGRYIPPALRGLSSSNTTSHDTSSTAASPDVSTLPPTNFPSGFRRARAGTLPSNVQLAAQRFAAVTGTLQSNTGSTDSFLDTYSAMQQSQQAATQAPAPPPVARPSLRHAASIATPAAASAALNERNSRLRSGSLTLPSQGLSNAFGQSLFGTSWLSGSRGASNFPVLDELRSVTSMDSGNVDEYDVHTLDYLGLDDSLRPPPAATISELRNQAQAAIAVNLANPPRMRAITVSNPYRTIAGVNGSLLSTPNGELQEEDLLDDYDTAASSLGRPSLESYNTGSYFPSSYVAKGFKQSQHLTASSALGARPRAISVGVLDDPSRLSQRLLSPAEQQSPYDELLAQTSGLGSSLLGGSLAKLNTRGLNSPAVHFSPAVETPGGRISQYLGAPAGQGRSVSPKAENSSSQIQTPTRSLWIGNLDSSVTSEQLIHIFAPYGAIESLRLLPEKECGFVNFVDQADAVRAKEDVLNRLGGQIGMPNGQTVRIGFGKAESAPVAPAKGSTVINTNLPSQGASTNKGPNSAGPLSSIESQLQSSPTRALWIGSIPSTTTPATILSVFSPFGPIESARVLTHKNCGFINFERLDDAVRARKSLNGRDVLGSDVGAIRIGFAKVPVKNGSDGSGTQDEGGPISVQGIGDLSVGATIHALRNVKGASTIPADQQVLGGALENYRSNLLLSMIGSGAHALPTDGPLKTAGYSPSVTEQQMIVKELSEGGPDAEAEALALADFRPPMMYYSTIPLVTERPNNRRWDASKLRELRKRLDSGNMTMHETEEVAADFLDGEIVDLASDWLGNTVVQKLFEKCGHGPRIAMLERLAPHLGTIGIHKNGTWAAQKIIECVQTPEEVALIAQNLRPYGPPLLLDQFGNYVVQCCLRFGAPANDFIFDAMVDRLWEVAQGRFGARSMRACLESPHVTINQQRRIATAIVLNSIPLATNPNGALLLTWLLDNSGFPSRYRLLAPRFTPHLSHLCTHKLASLTVLRIINQKIEPEASTQIVHALFFSPGDHVLADVLGDQVNGVAVVHKILTSPFIDLNDRPSYLEATKRVLIELKVIATQAYRRLIEEVGLPVPNFQSAYSTNLPQPSKPQSPSGGYAPGMSPVYSNDQNLASIMAALQMGGQSHMSPQLAGPPQMTGPPQMAGPPQLQIDPLYNQNAARARGMNPTSTFTPSADPFNPFNSRSPDINNPRNVARRNGGPISSAISPSPLQTMPYAPQSPIMGQTGNLMGMNPTPYGLQSPQSVPPHVYQAYMYQMYQQQQNPANVGNY